MPKQPDVSKIEAIRHSLAHLLAAAVLKKFPDAKLGIGPTIDNGFYYDFLLPRTLTPEDLKELEKTMRGLAHQNLPFSGKEVTAAEAKKVFKDQQFKLDLIKEFSNPPADGKKPLTIYYTGDAFFDLCRGGHVENTKEIPADAFKLDKIAGAYWRGDEKNPQLQRIYGLAFETKKELEDYLKLREEAAKRDHKILGKKLRLFVFSPEVGPGLPMYTPRGNAIRETLLNYIAGLKRSRGYSFVWTPHLAKKQLYIKSGHLGKYDAMLPPIKIEDDEELVVKPMNCPHHFAIYNSEPHSYRDLPFRIAENATDYRNEKSGELNGLFRVRSLTQDDTHHIIRHDQIASEIDTILGLTREVYENFGFKNYKVEISTWDPKNKKKYFGTEKAWEEAQNSLIAGAKRWNAPYKVVEGEAAFYGPKIDIRVEDALGRDWQLTTVQLDYNQPENFDMTYTDDKGGKARPVVIHAAILGSVDRFMGVIIEHFAGAFPLWLAPVQVSILPISEKQNKYCSAILEKLSASGVRAEMPDANESLGKRIREAEIMKVPYVLVAGEKEEKNGTINVRHYKRGQEGEIDIENLLEKISSEIKNKVI
ncbi:MAG: threonine--tRNA ligase [Patescibacteria group bacterium]|nr:threonine--tRNA ligase [Patescibacteria group bacterium]MDE2014976.1 threonine--tRNA ligase [Patescibacteria group bacterium]MDE2226405.1 threonine--tRNA ligase [Patescibacteria group bacterium]